MFKSIRYCGILYLIINTFIILCGKIHPLGKLFLVPELNYQTDYPGYRYGDLYRFSHVSLFKELIPNSPPSPNTCTIDDCDVLLIGDSFFESSIDGDRFGVSLELASKYKVFDITYNRVEPSFRPLQYLESVNYKNAKRKILILETVERYVPDRVLQSYLDENSKYLQIKEFIKNNSDDFLKNKDLKFFYDNNIFTEKLINVKADLNFYLFNQINDMTPVYSIEPPMLFYKDEFEFDTAYKSDDKIENIVNHLIKLNKILNDRYNLELVILVIPNKFSVYCDYVSEKYKYDDFIPKLTEKLLSKNINTIDLYSALIVSKHNSKQDLLYYYSDTHFNSLGKGIVLNECNKLLNSILNNQ